MQSSFRHFGAVFFLILGVSFISIASYYYQNVREEVKPVEFEAPPSIASKEGLGFFDDVPDNIWSIKKYVANNQAKKQSNNQLAPSGSYFQDNWEPDFSCDTEMRIGPYGDGGKWVCDPHKLSSGSRECFVLSIGSRNDFGFENDLFNRYNNCSIHVFDHTVANPTPPKGIFFHKFGLGTPGSSSGNLLDLSNIIKEAGIPAQSAIEILKIDIEGKEFSTILPLLQSGAICKDMFIRQILIEIHPNSEIKLISSILDAFKKCGYAIFHKEPNIKYPVDAPRNEICTEFAFIKLASTFWDN